MRDIDLIKMQRKIIDELNEKLTKIETDLFILKLVVEKYCKSIANEPSGQVRIQDANGKWQWGHVKSTTSATDYIPSSENGGANENNKK